MSLDVLAHVASETLKKEPNGSKKSDKSSHKKVNWLKHKIFLEVIVMIMSTSNNACFNIFCTLTIMIAIDLEQYNV